MEFDEYLEIKWILNNNKACICWQLCFYKLCSKQIDWDMVSWKIGSDLTPLEASFQELFV